MLDKKTDYWIEGDGSAIIVDTLPEAGAENTIYLVLDGNMYSAYKYENGEFVSVSGGGSSDFSTANVTINGFPEGTMIPVFGAFAVEQQEDLPMSVTSPLMQGNGTYTVVMYKRNALLSAAAGSDYIISSVTGDIEIMNGTAVIHGDGTITVTHSGTSS